MLIYNINKYEGKIMKKSLSLAVLLSLSTVGSVHSLSANELEISGNVGVASNYIWRGMTQTKDDSQVSGGVDLGLQGFYLGTWASNIDFGDDADAEIDFYAGYGNSIENFSYDLSYIYYMYPSSDAELDFQEIALSLGYEIDALSLGASYSFGIDTEDNSAKTLDYAEATASYTGDNYTVGFSKTIDLNGNSLDLAISYADFDHETDATSDEENVYASITYSF
jgi:uncharacterized protein (TIGR02001 family)